MATDNTDEDERELIKIYKKLYLLTIGMNLNKMDFIKAIANKFPKIKSVGYIGLSLMPLDKHLVLLYNILQKDVENELYTSDVLSFISHISIGDDSIKDMILKTKIPDESLNTYLKYLPVKSKYEDTISFPLASITDHNLNIKIQIILNRGLESQLDQNDIKMLILKVKSVGCSFLKLKILSLLHRLALIYKLPFDSTLAPF